MRINFKNYTVRTLRFTNASNDKGRVSLIGEVGSEVQYIKENNESHVQYKIRVRSEKGVDHLELFLDMSAAYDVVNDKEEKIDTIVEDWIKLESYKSLVCFASTIIANITLTLGIEPISIPIEGDESIKTRMLQK